MNNIDEKKELSEAEKSLYLLGDFASPYFMLDEYNIEKVCKYIDKIDLSRFVKNGEIEIKVAPCEKDFKVDWSNFLNSITNRGYKVNFKINANCGSIDQGIEKEDVIKKILEYKDKIKNEKNIKFGYSIGNFYGMGIDKYKEIEDALDLCAEDIKEKNFSPLENLVAAYKVTVGMFLADNQEIANADSYDKYSSITMFPNVKPMCQSYTQIFSSLCNKLNIECRNHGVFADGNHSTNIVEIEDDKYNISGSYFVDITLAANLLKRDTKELIEIGGKVDDNLAIAPCVFCIGYDEIEFWARFYKFTEFKRYKWLKLSDKGIQQDILEEAARVVNEAYVVNSKRK